jgi:putative hydrolase of the HAD superfamily
MLEAVAAARAAGYATACLTNSFGLVPFDPYAPWELEERFDVVVISEQEKLRKPEPEIYRRALERIAVAADECLYLDDIEENLTPARALGMTAWLVTDPAAAARRITSALDF